MNLLLISLPVVAGGCRSYWKSPRAPSRLQLHQLDLSDRLGACHGGDGFGTSTGSVCKCSAAASLRSARSAASQALQAEQAGQEQAIELYFHSTVQAWNAWTDGGASEKEVSQAHELYHSSLAKLLELSTHQQRLIPGQGIKLSRQNQHQLIPIEMVGFVWRPEDAQGLVPVGDYHASGLSRQYRRSGVGVPVVVRRSGRTNAYGEEAFLPASSLFAATAVLRPDPEGGGAALELYDPLRTYSLSSEFIASQIATDISAPFALREFCDSDGNTGWNLFVNPTASGQEGLLLLEPYQPGKIPVVFVHGLLGSPDSWLDMANDLRAIHGFTDRFQIWGFRYASGQPFLSAATRLREDLYRVAATVDPTGQDPALQQIVLVGHSMGGLVCKLQACYSEDRLWRSVASQPLEHIRTSETVRQQLRDQFFFEPQPLVRRVVFIATPHAGSSWANRPIGRLSASLAEPDPQRATRHAQLIQDNPDVFSREASVGIPTSIDMLNPDSQLLQTISKLPASSQVQFHSIAGRGFFNLAEGHGDGVVSLRSAASPFPASEHTVRAFHTNVHRKLESSEEIWRILKLHLSENCQEQRNQAF